MDEIERLEGEDPVECSALKKLCADECGQGLGGLPLALAQAGSFIALFNYSFSEYLILLESADEKNWHEFINKTEELKSIRESQRSIWTTWKISVEKLSAKSYTVLRAMAMLGQGGIGESIVNGILKVAAAAEDGSGSDEGIFRNIIVKELIHGSSLIWCDEGEGEGSRVYNMHRLVRRFILNDMVRGSATWNEAYSLALPAVHQNVKTELEKEGNSFSDLRDVFENNHRELLEHSVALVYLHMLPVQSSPVWCISQVEEIHRYSGMVIRFMGKPEEEVQVWQDLL